MPRTVSLRLLFAYFFFALSTTTQAEARSVYTVYSTDRFTFIEMRDRALCNLTVAGEISPGDSSRLREFISSNFALQPPDERSWIACLHSTGGNFAEGIRIGEIFREFGFATRVRSFDICLSACAVAFLYGTFQLYDDEFNLRILDRGGRVGWHAPSLRMLGSSSDQRALNVIYNEALSDLADFIESAGSSPRSRARQILPRELLPNMLSVGSESFYYLETVGQLIQYDIMLSRVNFRFPSQYAAPESWRIWVCYNALRALGLDFDPSEESFRYTYLHNRLHHFGIPNPPAGWESFHVGDFWTNACHTRYNSEEAYFNVNTYITGSQTGSTTLQLFSILPPSTRILDLP